MVQSKNKSLAPNKVKAVIIKMCGGKKCGSNWAGATTGTALNDLKKAA
jgi:hypothetical protein